MIFLDMSLICQLYPRNKIQQLCKNGNYGTQGHAIYYVASINLVCIDGGGGIESHGLSISLPLPICLAQEVGLVIRV